MPLTAKDAVKARFNRLKKQLEATSNLAQEQARKTERSMIGWSFNGYLLSEAPLIADGMTGFAVAFITDGLREGGGVGVLAFYSLADDAWLRVSDNVVVTI